MPTSTLRHTLGARLPLGALAVPPNYRPDMVMIGTWSIQAIGDDFNAIYAANFGSGTYPSANRAIAFPFELSDYFLAQKVWWMNGTTATTNSADVGVYTEAGSLLISGGGTAIATANVVQEADPGDVLLQPGRYWCAYAQDGTTATPTGLSMTAAQSRSCGCAQMDTAYTLPSTFTPAAVAGSFIPLFGIAGRTQVA